MDVPLPLFKEVHVRPADFHLDCELRLGKALSLTVGFPIKETVAKENFRRSDVGLVTRQSLTRAEDVKVDKQDDPANQNNRPSPLPYGCFLAAIRVVFSVRSLFEKYQNGHFQG